jgi:cytochrome c oxidase subunit II
VTRPARRIGRSSFPLLLLTGCSGAQHALDPAGPAAARIAGLWWEMFILASIITIVVLVILSIAVQRGRRRHQGDSDAGTIDGAKLVWAGGVIVPLVVVFYLVVQTGVVGTAVYRQPLPAADEHLVVEVVGHMFWWEVRYPQLGITTANEIYIPAGENILVRVTSPDVIHSFWVPRLHGKIDMVPGRTNSIWLRSEEPGLFRGQCAEYCGAGHALMAFWVEAMRPTEFAAWVQTRRAAPTPLLDPTLQRGEEVFFAWGCANCHATRGAPLPEPLGSVGPDLSDFGRRRTIAAGTRPNNPGTLAAWIVNPQRIKPGSRMPATHLDGESLQALVSYLGSLR